MNLQQLRVKSNYSQSDIDNELGVSRQTISNYEKGNREPSIERFKKLANLYSVSLEQIIKAIETSC